MADLAGLKYEDLIVPCAACGGEGYAGPAPAAASGLPGIGPVREFRSCRECGGEGERLTPAGRVLARFIQELRRPLQ